MRQLDSVELNLTRLIRLKNVQAVVEACGFVLKIEIAEPEQDTDLDVRLETSLLQAPQQRVKALLDELGGS